MKMVGGYYTLFPLNSTKLAFPVTEPKDIYEESESSL